MSIFKRHIGTSIYQATIFVLCAFLAMFLFFDFLAEMDEVGIGRYGLTQAVMNVLLGIPSRTVELAPIAVLIGTLWALSQSAANSEFTVFRVSGLQPAVMVRTILKIGAPMIAFIILCAEVLVPGAEGLRAKVFEGAAGAGLSSGQMRTGLWLRDSKDALPTQAPVVTKESRFVNAQRFNPNQTLDRITIYDFDRGQRLTQTLRAQSARYAGQNQSYRWVLVDVEQTLFSADGRVSIRKLAEMEIASMLSPEMLGALVTNPDRMSSIDLYRYVQYLKQNKQQSERYEIAFWKRLIYPFAIWVMMFLALPAAFLQARAGAVGARVLIGIIGGVAFHLLNNLFSHVGVLSTWPAPVMVMLPSLIALTVAAGFFYWVQYR